MMSGDSQHHNTDDDLQSSPSSSPRPNDVMTDQDESASRMSSMTKLMRFYGIPADDVHETIHSRLDKATNDGSNSNNGSAFSLKLRKFYGISSTDQEAQLHRWNKNRRNNRIASRRRSLSAGQRCEVISNKPQRMLRARSVRFFRKVDDLQEEFDFATHKIVRRTSDPGPPPSPTTIAPNKVRASRRGSTGLRPCIKRDTATIQIGDLLGAKLKVAEETSQTRVTLEPLIKGAWMTKYNQQSRHARRFVRINKEGTELQWGRRKGITTSKIELAEVCDIIFAPRTPAFKDYDWVNGQPWLCFSLSTEVRTYDFVCDDSNTVEQWVLGLQKCMAMKQSSMVTKGQLLWLRLLFHAIQMGMRVGIDTVEVLRVLEVEAKKKLRRDRIKKCVVNLWAYNDEESMTNSLDEY